VIVFLGIGLRYFELGVIAATLLLTGLLFIRLRPPGLVWVSVLAMCVLLAHLYLEQGRWQFIPLYAVVFGFAIWLAVPGRNRYRSGGLVLRIGLTLFVVFPALILLLAVPLFVVPQPTGPHGVGVAAMVATPDDGPALPVTIRYPLSDDATAGRSDGWSGLPGGFDRSRAILAPYWSLGEVGAHSLPGLPWLVGTHLTLVPTNSILRGQRADGAFPVAIMIPSPTSLPSDYLVLAEQIASLGWIVVQAPASATSADLVWLLDELHSGDLDSAFDGAVDTNRTVLVALGWDPGVDIGLPSIRVGGGQLLSVVTAGSSYEIVLPESRIPDEALTNRYLMVRPAQLLVGSSDIPPADISTVLTQTVSALLTDGRLSAPVFTAEPAQSALAGAQSMLADLLPDLTIQARPGTR
jgi:hypothetical protein